MRLIHFTLITLAVSASGFGLATAADPSPSPVTSPAPAASVAAPVQTPTPAPGGVTTPAVSGAVTAPTGAAGMTEEPVATPEPPRTGSVSDYKKFRDPFQQQIDKNASGTVKPDLELYSTTEFKLTGVITGPMRMRAILVSPKGKSFIVNEGTRIGLREGKIRKISTRSVLVDEQGTNELGEIEKAEVEIALEENAVAGR